MKLNFWQSDTGSRPLSDSLRREMVREGVNGEVAQRFLMFVKKASLAGRKVRYFLIYDPSAKNSSTAPASYDDCERSPESVVFEGHFESTGQVVIFPKKVNGRPTAALTACLGHVAN